MLWNWSLGETLRHRCTTIITPQLRLKAIDDASAAVAEATPANGVGCHDDADDDGDDDYEHASDEAADAAVVPPAVSATDLGHDDIEHASAEATEAADIPPAPRPQCGRHRLGDEVFRGSQFRCLGLIGSRGGVLSGALGVE